MSSLGSLRETRLTATLAFLVSRFPEEFLFLLGEKLDSTSYVSVEESDEGDRYDILVKNGIYPVILEGKVRLRQNTQQLLRYIRNVRARYHCRPKLVIIDTGSQTAQVMSEEFKKLGKEIADKPRFCTWN